MLLLLIGVFGFDDSSVHSILISQISAFTLERLFASPQWRRDILISSGF